MIDNFHKVGEIDIKPWLTNVDTLTSEIWGEDSWRQETYSVHQDTQTISLVFDKYFEKPIKTEHYKMFETNLMPLESLLSTRYGNGFTARLILTKLKPKGVIPEHQDNGECFQVSHRVHLPLITNDEVLFSVGEETITMQPGELWEINNTNRPHQVVNMSDSERIHLIIDWEPYNGVSSGQHTAL